MRSIALSKLKGLAIAGAVAATALAAVAAPAGAASADAAAPYLLKPGVNAHYSANVAYFTARVYCGDWKGIAQLTIGTQGVRVLTKTKYICERASSTTVNFAIAGGALPVDGRYQYTIKVGRHDREGNATRWTHSLHGFFTKY
jgi:hypothetical protein